MEQRATNRKINNCLLSSGKTLTAIGGPYIKHHGTITIPCSYKEEITRASFCVTDIPGPAIINLQTSTDLMLIIFNFSYHENVTTPRNYKKKK